MPTQTQTPPDVLHPSAKPVRTSLAAVLLPAALAGLSLISAGCARWSAPGASTGETSTAPTTAAPIIGAQNFECPVKPTGLNFSGQNLTNKNFHAVEAGSLVGANFEGATLKGAVFSGQDLSGASFKGADLGPSSEGNVDLSETTLTNTCFIGATMNATVFSYAKLECTDFSGTSLMKAQFGPLQNIAAGTGCRTRFNYATLEVQAIDTSNWGQTDFSYANLQNLSPSTFSLKGKDITGAILVGVDMTGIDMAGMNATGVDWSYVKLLHVNMENAALNGAKMVHAEAAFANLQCARFYGSKKEGDPCSATPASSNPDVAADLTQANLGRADFTQGTLDYAILHGTNLSGANLTKVSFVEASLEPQGGIGAASLLGATMTGANFTKAALNSVRFDSVIMPRAIFDDTTLQNTSFAGAIMADASFDSAILEGVSFHGSILEQAKFTGRATLKTTPGGGGSGVDFTCAQLGGADFTDAVVEAANFEAAVMPLAAACCPLKAGFEWCGTVNSAQQRYGPVIVPILDTAMNCPNGDVAPCSGGQWQIPDWQTDLCNLDHNVETVWSRPPCGTPPGKNVHFNDMHLKQCILDTLPGTPLFVTVKTAATIPNLDCPALGIKDLTGLDNFTSLNSLDLAANQLTQFALKLPRLTTLKIADNQLTLLDLSSVTGLIRLDASNNKLQSVQHLDVVQALEILDLSHNQLTDLDLAIQGSMQYADLSHNKLTTVLDTNNKTLDRLDNLSYLDLSFNSLDTLGSLQSISYSGSENADGFLEQFYIECNPNFDCKSLGLDGSYEALQTSQCAAFNTASNKWIPQIHPTCHR